MSVKKKYELTDETIEVDGKTLHRIRALKDFGDVKAGDLGGFIENEINLSHYGNCWVAGKAVIYGGGGFSGNAKIFGYGEVKGTEYFRDNDEVYLPSKNANEAHKNDDGKPRVDLIPPLALMEIGRVLEFGAKKYGANNWRNGMHWSRFHGAALRHLLAWFGGESKDAESDLSHLAHAACCLLFLMECEAQQIGCDDRPYKN
ncbi:dATP/dGTP diphosphohydrolase domain-containing protein [Bartonella sp. ML71XJBT]|uniref:dATP/dGTP diphosphohydrolase domain-containing protein n=1 Tax=Bartonella sp. ML71XJBT TaxID=3019094 RepID=UPI0023608BA1|nr:dATP/dGTP diphosphohydrolase domain-containing protein [Bartonella sp. ML71XJBT]